MSETGEQVQTQDRIELLNEALGSGRFARVRAMLGELRAADVAHLLESTPKPGRDVLWRLVEKDQEGDILQYLNDEVRNHFIDQMHPQELADATSGMDSDDIADILGDLPEHVSQQVLRLPDEENRQRVEQVLSYPEDTAGGLMNTDTVTIKPHVTVEVVLRYLRMRNELPTNTDSLFVVDKYDRFVGAVPLSSLLVADTEKLITDILQPDVESIAVDKGANEVAQIFERRDLVSAPVTDADGKLLGRITIDDVVDVIREEAEHSLMSMVGLDEDVDTFAPVWSTAKKRALWLGINLLTVLIASRVIGMFEDTIKIVTALAILQPIVPSMGGVAGTQTLTLMIRGLSLGQIGSSNARWLMLRELRVSLLNGLLWALVVGVIAYVWFLDTGKSLLLAITIAGAMVINLVMGVVAGAALPLILRRLKMDPVLSGSVILTTVTDVIGFFAFLGLATLFFA